MKNILLKFDEKFYFKLLDHKQKIQKERGQMLTWESYIKILLGLKDAN